MAALILCSIGVPVLLDLAGHTGPAIFLACLVYSITLVVCLACSTALYHLRLRIERRRLRQFDHAAIFLLIAGTCTPFTTSLPSGTEAVAITAAIWAIAIASTVYKLARPLPFPGFSAIGYLTVAAIVLIGSWPVLYAAEPPISILLVAGMAIYVAGALLRLRRSLRYRNTIWHAMVIAAAACHYAAIFGVVLRVL